MNSANGMGPPARMRGGQHCREPFTASAFREASFGRHSSCRWGLHVNISMMKSCKPIVELLLKGPGKLAIFNLSRPKQKNIRMNQRFRGRISDFDFDALRGWTRAKDEQRVLVTCEFDAHFSARAFMAFRLRTRSPIRRARSSPPQDFFKCCERARIKQDKMNSFERRGPFR